MVIMILDLVLTFNFVFICNALMGCYQNLCLIYLLKFHFYLCLIYLLKFHFYVIVD